jgi:hypothetical protein
MLFKKVTPLTSEKTQKLCHITLKTYRRTLPHPGRKMIHEVPGDQGRPYSGQVSGSRSRVRPGNRTSAGSREAPERVDHPH